MRHLIISILFIIVGLLGMGYAALWECVKELDRGR